MLRNYLRITLRSLWQNRLYTILNMGGLAIGLTACLLMTLYVRHEFTYDSYHKNADRIIRITTELKTPDAPMSVAATPILLATVLKRDYPEIETAARFEPTAATIRYGDKLVNETDVYKADQDAFSVFTYQFVAGSPAQALTRPNSAVVTESFARKYAGRIDIIGQSFQCNKETYQITGVLADLPSNTDLKFNVLLSKDFTTSTEWLAEDFPAYTFALFREQPVLTRFAQKLALLSRKYIQPEFRKLDAEGYSLIFHTEPLKDVHFSQGKMADHPKGNRQYGYLFVFLAVFVLLIALLNYINLLTARATERAREVGIRKANGAIRSQLVGQFLFETFLMSAGAVTLAVILVIVLVPFLNELLQIQLRLPMADGLFMTIAVLLSTTILGGLYPAFVLSGYDPSKALRGQLGHFGRGLWLRRSITIFQFVLAVCMIIGVLVIRGQMNFLQQTSLGFNKDQVLSLSLPDDSVARAIAPAFGQTLRQRSEISLVSLGSGLKPDGLLPMATTTFTVNGKKRETMNNYFFIDEQFMPMLDMKLVDGRNITNTLTVDKKGAFLVNEAFVKMAGWQQAIGQNIEGFMHKGKVVGVVKNFHYRSLHNAIEPLVLIYNTFPASNVMLKIHPEHLPLVETIWKKFYPGFPFEYSFLDTAFDAQYQKDRLMTTLFNGFALLTILVSCLGLFGLATFSTQQRTKEIGIRKVLGASVSSVVALLAQDFMKLVVVSIIIASPLAWYLMNRWLESFAYKIAIEWWMFALAGLLSISIALLTLSYQSIRAALTNPVESLRSE